MRGQESGERRRLAAPALASLLLHAGAALALAALLAVEPLPAPPQEQGVEIVWQDSQEDAAPGEEAMASPAESAEAPSQPPPAGSGQDLAESAPPQAVPLQAEAPEPPPPEPAPPGPALAEAPPPLEPEPALAGALPPPEEPASPIAEPLPAQAAETPPRPTPEPVEARAAPTPEEQRPADLPLPPPTPPPAPASPPAPAPAPARSAAHRQQAAQFAAAAAPRPAPPGPAAPPDAAPGGSRATGAVMPPGLLDGVRNPEPEYPFASRQRGDQGVVTVRLGVSAAGEVTEVEVVASSGYPELDESARRAVQRWRFRPATRDGAPVAGSIRTAIHFRLR